jgi:uncharacterized protein (TIGR00730 family)
MKAYENMDFLHSADGRLVRVMTEFLEPQRRLKAHRIQDTIVFFGSARSISSVDAQKRLQELKATTPVGSEAITEHQAKLKRAEAMVKLAPYYDDAVELAKQLTHWSKGLHNRAKRFIICSGGGPGMMEAANKGASQEGGGLSVGFTISMPGNNEAANPHISEDLNFEFHYFFMRKYWFAYLAKALVIFPGGFGTLDELMEVLTLVQTKKMKKEIPIVIYGRKYWNDIINLEKMVEV